MPQLGIVILAAGASSRMGGRDKLMQEVAPGQPLLAQRIGAARATGQPVWVALPPRAQAPGRWEAASGAHLVEIARPEAGMGASLARLVQALPADIAGAMVLPADMPDITTADMTRLLEAFDPGQVVRGATAEGRPGHPVLFPRSWFDRLVHLTGDRGARDLLCDTNPRLIPLPGRHALTDLDSPADWAAWRAGRQPRRS